jgi:hypothetical protein
MNLVRYWTVRESSKSSSVSSSLYRAFKLLGHTRISIIYNYDFLTALSDGVVDNHGENSISVEEEEVRVDVEVTQLERTLCHYLNNITHYKF